MAIKKILVPVDFSEPSEQALEYALDFAKPFKAEITLLFVIKPLYYAGDLGLLLEEQQRTGREELARLERRVRQRGLKCRTLVLRGAPFREIVDAARKQKVDLIVMGTHGRTGLSHLVMGSVADRVVRTAATPVLTVQPQKRRRRKA